MPSEKENVGSWIGRCRNCGKYFEIKKHHELCSVECEDAYLKYLNSMQETK